MSAIFNRRALMTAAGASAITFAASPSVFAQAPDTLPPAPKPEDWIKAPAVQFPSLSPDGLHTVFLSEESGNKFLNTFDIAAKKPGKINIGSAQVDSIQWVSNVHVLVLTSVPSKRVNPQAGPGNYTIALVYNLQAGTLLRLYDKVPKFGGLVNGDVHFIRRNGRNMVTASGVRDDQDGFLYLYAFDLDGKDYEMLDRAPQETIGWVVGGDGSLVARWAYYFVRKEWVLECYNGKAWKEINRTKVVRYLPEIYGLGRDGKSLLVKTYDDDGDVGTYRELASDGTFSSPLNDASGREPIVHPRTNMLLGFTP